MVPTGTLIRSMKVTTTMDTNEQVMGSRSQGNRESDGAR
jgi:hypothetical protein